MVISSQIGLLSDALKRVSLMGSALMPRPVKLFSYDDLMSTATLEEIGVFPGRSIMGYVNDYAIGVHGRSEDDRVGNVSVVSKPNAKTYGVLHDVTSFELLLVDFIATARGFDRKMVLVTDRHGYEEMGWIYVVRCPKDDLKVRPEILQRILQTAEDQHLPPMYLVDLALLPRLEPVRNDVATAPEGDVMSEPAGESHCVGFRSSEPRGF